MNLAVADFVDVIDRALDRGAALLTAGERTVVDRMRGLSGEAAIAYARLTTRVPSVFELDRLTIADVLDLPAALEALRAAGLVDDLVTWDERAQHLRKDDLAAILRALSLPTRGRRDALVERLRGRTGYTRARFVRVRHRGLVRRLERWAFLRPFPDRGAVVKDRLGVVKWRTYPTTSGVALPATRAAWLAYEKLAGALSGVGPPLTPRQALDALRDGTARPPGRLDLSRILRRELATLGQTLERQGRFEEACSLYQRLVEEGGHPLPEVAFRWAQALVATERPADALALLKEARPLASATDRIAIVRGMRRIAKRLGRSVAPDPPLRTPRRRTLRLERQPDSDAARGRWGDQGYAVEAAVCRWLAQHGRTARFGEGRPFSTLFALLFAEVLFLPVPGALPVRFLSGPLDLGTPAFRAARRDAIEAVWSAVEGGSARARVRDAWARYEGVRMVGARWDQCHLWELEALAEHLGPAGLRAILEPMLDRGPGERAGLPDLVVWPGPAIRLPDALPSRLSEDLCLAEIKSPNDRLRDGQRVWLDRLLEAGVPTELWEVTEPPGNPRDREGRVNGGRSRAV